ncbi:MAG: transcription termination/antitermination protein NusA [Campylobacteraceae bacterium]|nr:transcription termination/antitermination protein NusA [Campylobacteraceae bacterium]
MEKVNDIIESIANEKNLDVEDVKERVKMAFVATAKRLFGDEYEYEAVYDNSSKTIKLFQKSTVVADDYVAEEEEHVIKVSKAKELNENAEVGDELNFQLDLDSFGRTASATLSKELSYHIQKLLEEKVFEKYLDKVGNLVFGNVVYVDPDDETTYIEFDDLRAFMPMKSRIKNEKFKVGDIVRAVIRRVFIDKKRGIRIEISRTTPKFLEEMLKAQVPEIEDGKIIIKDSARIPGRRAKVSLVTLSPNIDPIGATVGIKGVRINAVSEELKGENIDVIEYSPQPEIYISRAMAPAIISSVKIDGEKAIVSLNSDQKSKAIGKDGINIRLASMLTGYEIELLELEKDENTPTTSSSGDVVKDLKSLFGDL